MRSRDARGEAVRSWARAVTGSHGRYGSRAAATSWRQCPFKCVRACLRTLTLSAREPHSGRETCAEEKNKKPLEVFSPQLI